MADLVCYRVRETVDDVAVEDFDDVVQRGDGQLDEYGPEDYGEFSVKLFVRRSVPHSPKWLPFLKEGFGPHVDVPDLSSAAALVVIAVGKPKRSTQSSTSTACVTS